MPTSNGVRYVALRRLRVGDGWIEPGEEVPVDDSWKTVRELCDGGDMVAIPPAPGQPFSVSASDDWRQPGVDLTDGSTKPSEDESEANQDNTDDSPEGDEGQNEEESLDSDPVTVTSSGYDPSEHTVEDVVEYALENEEEVTELIEAETNSRARKTLLSQLTMLIEGD